MMRLPRFRLADVRRNRGKLKIDRRSRRIPVHPPTSLYDAQHLVNLLQLILLRILNFGMQDGADQHFPVTPNAVDNDG